MKSFVDQDTCISCGLCVSAYDELYTFNDDGKAECIVDAIPPECEEDARQAELNCPVNAIKVSE